jgi:hypothetical protein
VLALWAGGAGDFTDEGGTAARVDAQARAQPSEGESAATSGGAESGEAMTHRQRKTKHSKTLVWRLRNWADMNCDNSYTAEFVESEWAEIVALVREAADVLDKKPLAVLPMRRRTP